MLKVWSAASIGADDYIDEVIYGKMMRVTCQKPASSLIAWVAMEEGVLCWYADRDVGCPAGSVCLHSVRHSKSCSLDHVIGVTMDGVGCVYMQTAGRVITFEGVTREIMKVKEQMKSAENEEDLAEREKLAVNAMEYASDMEVFYRYLYRTHFSSLHSNVYPKQSVPVVVPLASRDSSGSFVGFLSM